MLNDYLQRTQLLIGDIKESRTNPYDLLRWINQARARIASETQCVRVLPPSSGSLVGLQINVPGIGYSNSDPITVGGPDAVGVGFTRAQIGVTTDRLTFQNLPFSNLLFGDGGVNGAIVTNPGSGYAMTPPVNVTSATGSGTSISALVSPRLVTKPQVEVYSFSDVVPLIAGQGVKSIIGVQSISVSWGSVRPVLSRVDWSSFQAYLRSSNVGSQNWPTYWSQYGQGVAGSVYLWPAPFQEMEMQWDCLCVPVDLTNDVTPEAIPWPWTDCVPYYAAFMAFQSIQDRDAANYMLAEAKRTMREGRAYGSPPVTPNFYAS